MAVSVQELGALCTLGVTAPTAAPRYRFGLLWLALGNERATGDASQEEMPACVFLYAVSVLASVWDYVCVSAMVKSEYGLNRLRLR